VETGVSLSRTAQFLNWGGRGGCSQLVSILEPPGHQKALALPGLNSGKTALVLSLTSHTVRMETHTLRWIGYSVALIALVAVWVAVIVTALHVSTVVLQTLDMIVELAAISP